MIVRAGGVRRAAAVSAATAVLLACSDALAPVDDGAGTPPPAFLAPKFLFAADAGGSTQLYIYQGDSARRFITSAGNDVEASSAAGRVAFSSDRDGNAEIYITDVAASIQRRVTNDPAADGEPALDPTGTRIAFVRNGSGTPRIWVVPAPALDGGAGGYGSAEPLETGSSALVPELSPAWSPDGGRIAFVSARTGISQVYVVSAPGGEAVQWTHETAGAFAPAWSDDGESIIYAAAGGANTLRRVAADGVASDVASDALGVGEPTCADGVCVAVTGAPTGGESGGLVVVTQDGRRARVVFDRSAHEQDPALLP
jgi:TolB protein